MPVAITRQVSRNIGRCELTHLDRTPIDLPAAREQHGRYEECLATLGCEVLRLPEEPDLPDSVFVEDAAIVLDELAVITRPGAASRRHETLSVAEALKPYRSLAHVEPPGLVDGGDVLVFGRILFVGLSGRSNKEAVDQLQILLAPFGYDVKGVLVKDCLHLKSAVTQVSQNTLLINGAWVEKTSFGSVNTIDVDPSEPFGANALRLGDTVVYPDSFVRTRRRMEDRGITVRTVEVSELGKAEGGVTCCSLILDG